MVRSHRTLLTPQMAEYTERLYEDGELRWLPYVMYFQPAGHRSAVVNTDRLGFRYSRCAERTVSPGERSSTGPVNVLAGNSVAFGVGATNDAATLTSRLWARRAGAPPWLNFGGRSYNSAQELLLFVLHRHLVPEIEHIVVLSGLNNLVLARQPASMRGQHGAFFMCGHYFEKLNDSGKRRRKGQADDGVLRDLSVRLAAAAELTVRHLETWRLLAEAIGARLSFVMQPFAPWTRERPVSQERSLFAELDEVFSFGKQYRDLSSTEVGRAYAGELRVRCEKIGVGFLDANPLLADLAGPEQWLFVDRAHLTDQGYGLLAGLLAEHLELS